MVTRRKFIERVAGAGTVGAGSFLAVHATGKPDNAKSPRKRPTVARSALTSLRIQSLVRREETILRYGGNGNTFQMSWAADGRQYVSICDGLGWFDTPQGPWNYNSRLWTIEG